MKNTLIPAQKDQVLQCHNMMPPATLHEAERVLEVWNTDLVDNVLLATANIFTDIDKIFSDKSSTDI